LDRPPVNHVPLVITGPCQPPLALHSSALLAVHVKVELLPLLIVVGDAVRVTMGAGWVTMTCTVCVIVPPDPVHVSV